jgi:hypothetical protein
LLLVHFLREPQYCFDANRFGEGYIVCKNDSSRILMLLMNEPLKRVYRSRAPARGCPISVKLREERMSLGKSREEDKAMLM